MACVLGAGVILGAGGAHLLRAAPEVEVRDAAASTPGFAPACPALSKDADGTVSPIFCTIDNPAALAHYAQALEPLDALGPNATPSQVRRVLAREFRGGGPNGEALTGTFPIQCQVFQLAAHRWRWTFSYAPQYCSLPPST